MSEFDKTRKTIGANNLDDKARREMFDKFQSAGGKVVSDKDKKREEALRKQKEQPQIRQGARSQTGGRDPRQNQSSQSGRSSAKQVASKPNPIMDRKALEDEMGNFSIVWRSDSNVGSPA